jgi:ankyrin repeat protein
MNSTKNEYEKQANQACFDLLLQHGADITAKNRIGFTILHVLAAYNNGNWREFMQIALDSGVDPNARGYFDTGDNRGIGLGRTALYLLAKSNAPDRLEVAMKLIQHGADLNIPDSEDRTPLDVISHRNPDKNKLEQLFQTGEINDVDEITEEVRNMMYNASQFNNNELQRNNNEEMPVRSERVKEKKNVRWA